MTDPRLSAILTTEGAAQLPRLERAVTYLEQSVWSWLALALGSMALGLWLSMAGVWPEPHCGWTVEEGQTVEAACSSLAEMEERLAEIRAERSGHRNWEEGQ